MPTANQKENAARAMEHLVTHWFHGYTQGWGRWGDGEGVCPVDGVDGTIYVEQGDRDCSAGTISAYESAGVDCGGATWTGDALDCMIASGNFRAHRMSDGWNCDDGYIAQRGDAYLAHHDGFQHMAMCVSAYPDLLAEFSIAENGTIYGQTGDQTGWESKISNFYGGWDWCLECIVDGSGDSSGSTDGVRYRVSTDPNGSYWFPEMIDYHDTGGSSDDYAGSYGSPIRWLAVQGATYHVYTQASGWLPWVSSYDINDLENGCAGDGSPILAVQVDNSSIEYQVHPIGGEWYTNLIGLQDTGGSGDDYAGDMANQIDGIAMRRI